MAETPIETLVDAFVASDQEELALDPMSSKTRAKVHEIAEALDITSYSQGGGNERHVVLSKKSRGPVTITDADMTNKLVRDLIKYTKLAIPVSKRYQGTWDLFYYFVDLMDDYCQSKKAVNMLKSAMKKAAEQNTTFNLILHGLKDDISKAIKATDAYKDLNPPSEKKEKKKTEKVVLPNGTKLFIPENSGCCYISLDIIQANFSALHHYYFESMINPDSGTPFDSWDEMLRYYMTKAGYDIEYFLKAKYFRQIVLGQLNGKRISGLQRRMQSSLFSAINQWNEEHPDEQLEILGSKGSDEMIIKTTEETMLRDCLNLQRIQQMADGGNYWRIDPFLLNQIADSKYYVKYHIDFDGTDLDIYERKVKFCCVEKKFFPQVYKYYYREIMGSDDPKYILTRNDLMFSDYDSIFMHMEPLFDQPLPEE